MKKLFKVIFLDENREIYELYAENVHTSDLFGFIEATGLVFIDSSDLIINPEDDKLKNMFKDTSRAIFPISNILRINEVTLTKDTPIIRIYKENNEKDS